MGNKYKKILTLDDLYNYYSTHKNSARFSSQKSGYKISVQTPATFTMDTSSEDDTLLFCNVKLFHTGKNRNASNVTDEAAKKAMANLAYKPLLANFCEYTDPMSGTVLKDFTAHDVMFNEDGSITYLEKQIGCFTADEPYLAMDEDLGHEFCYAKVAIPTEYTDAVDIIKRKNGTKVSVELVINEMNYNASTKTLDLTDVTIQGATCLGVNPETGNEVQEGMRGARLSLKDFSEQNNSLFSFVDKQDYSNLVKMLDKLNNTLSSLNINNSFEVQKKGGTEQAMNKFEELLSQYGKTAEDIDFDYSGMTDEELESKFEELFSNEQEPVIEDNSEEDTEKFEDIKEDNPEDQDDIENNPEEDLDDSDEEDKDDVKETESEIESESQGNFSKTFELSHDDVRRGLYELLSTVETSLNEFDWIVSVYDNYFIYQNEGTNQFYKQSYVKEDNALSFDGERIELFAEFLTLDEKNTLADMRSNYASISDELAKYKEAELVADRMSVFEDKAYAKYLDTDEFKSLMDKESVLKFSKDELIEKADAILGKMNRKNMTFAETTEPKVQKKTAHFFAFTQAEHENSFLDGLLKLNR